MSEPTLNNKDIKDESDNRKAFTYITHFDSKGIWNYKPTERIMAEHKGISGERENGLFLAEHRVQKGLLAALLTAKEMSGERVHGFRL